MEAEEVHFEVKDFAGRTIICTELQWEDHVCGRNHRYMDGAEKEVIEALQAPDNNIRYIDRHYPNRRAYYKLSWSKDYFTKVIVQYRDEKCDGTGFLYTAYMPDEITKGEKPEI